MAALALVAEAHNQTVDWSVVRPVIAAIGGFGDLGFNKLGIDTVLVAEPDVLGVLHRAHAMAITRVTHANFAKWIRTG